MQRVFEADGQKVLGFDTGLDSRAFAQAKIAQFITEPGLIVHTGGPNGDNGSVETWRASGVMEAAAGLPGGNPSMVVWGPAFEGDRLDLLIDDNGQRDGALAAVCLWIKAVLAVKKNNYGGAPL
ncbi:MAG: hypothetical protein FWH38_03285, partial [Treponema sp.]|nr:hypothetical protein [Treponema sp.]